MECFIIKKGMEQKAELEDILPLLEDLQIQNIFWEANHSYVHLPFSLAYMAIEVKELIYRNILIRIRKRLEKEVSETESKYDRDNSCLQEDRANLLFFIGDYVKKHSYELPKYIVWKEPEQNEKTQMEEVPNLIEELKQKIEEACNTGCLKISYYYTHNMTNEEIRKAFSAFLDRKNELQRIKKIEIEGRGLPGATLLFETGTLEELKIETSYREFIGSWPSFLDECYSLKSIELGLWDGTGEFPPWIRNAVSLQRLYIWGTNLTAIPDWIDDLQSIIELSINYNNGNLKTLPNSLGNLKNLAKLHIRNSGIKKLPDSISNLASLRELSLESNKNLISLPDSLANLGNIEKFYLSNSTIESLPDWIGNLKSLSQLCLVENKRLTRLPESISKLKNLNKLDLSGLSIERLPDWIGDLNNLAELSLKDNKNLKFLPDSIGKLINLVKLDLFGTPIENIPETIANCASLEFLDIRRTNINLVPNFISKINTIRQSIELIPKEHSISYRSFCNCYYRLVETIIQSAINSRQEGLLSLENYIENLANDFFYRGMRLVVDGTDYNIIRHILLLEIEREHDYYKKKLLEIAMEGALCIQAGDNVRWIILKLSPMVDIKDNPLDAACAKYLAGDYEAFDNIDLKAVIQPEEEREERRFIRRVMTLSEVSRKEGILALEKHLDYEGIKARDVFEYGLPLVIDGWDFEQIDKILSMLITHETNTVSKNLALAKKDAVRMIYEYDNPRVIIETLFNYFEESVYRGLMEEESIYGMFHY